MDSQIPKHSTVLRFLKADRHAIQRRSFHDGRMMSTNLTRLKEADSDRRAMLGKGDIARIVSRLHSVGKLFSPQPSNGFSGNPLRTQVVLVAEDRTWSIPEMAGKPPSDFSSC